MKNSLEGFNNRFKQAGGRISELEESTIEIPRPEEQKEKIISNNEQGLGDLWDPLNISMYI